MKRRVGVAIAAAVGLFGGVASAAPQATAGLTVGVAGVAPETPIELQSGAIPRRFWQDSEFHLGLRGDVLFGRSRNADFGVGPYAEVLTHAFDEVQFGGGGSLLLPVLDTFPVVVSAGGYARKASDGFGLTPGVAATLFWGSRSYNFHANYVLAAGLLTEMRYGLGANHETSIIVGAQLDLVALSLPVVLLVNALRGGSADTRPVR